MSQEKRHLHAQYAREIEAAHSCLSDNETTLNEKHADYIRQIVNQHQNGNRSTIILYVCLLIDVYADIYAM